MAKRYKIPIEEYSDGKKTVMFSTAIKDLDIGKNQSVMMYFTPDQPVATLYVFDDISEIAMWLQSDSTNRIGFVKSDEELKANSVTTEEAVEVVETKSEESSLKV